MYEPEPRMPLHLESRATRAGDMAAALFWAIDESGLRLPSRRDIARHSRVSEATISRRLRDSGGTEEHLAGRLAGARARTYPPGYRSEGWRRWLPDTTQDLQDTRAWVACLALAAHSQVVLDQVLQAWESEHDRLVAELDSDAHDVVPDEVEAAAEILLAVVLGLSIRRAVDQRLTHDRATDLLERAVAGVRPAA